MVAPVPFTLESLLDAVVEACVQELTAAQAKARAATELTVSLRERVTELEKLLGARDAEIEGARRRLLDVQARLELPPAPPAHMQASATNPAPITRDPRPARAVYRDPRGPGDDLTAERVGSYVCDGRAPGRSADGLIIWAFRCELCGSKKVYTERRARLNQKAGITCPCTKAGGKPAHRAIIDRTGLVLGLFTCEGGNGAEGAERRWNFRCGTCKGRLALTPGKVSGYISDGKTPRCTTCEPDRRGRKPAQKQAPPADAESRDEPPLDLDFSELDTIDGGRSGDDLDELLEQSMRDAEGDGRLRAIARFGEREDEDDEDEDSEEDDDQAEAAEA